MASNPVSCSNCGAENPPDQDFCRECDQPLTGSADQGLRENLEAQDQGGVLGGGSADLGGPASAPTAGLGGVASPLTTDLGGTDEKVPPHA